MVVIQVNQMLLVHGHNVHSTVIVGMENDAPIKINDVRVGMYCWLDAKFRAQSKPKNFPKLLSVNKFSCIPMAMKVRAKLFDVIVIFLRSGPKIFKR